GVRPQPDIYAETEYPRTAGWSPLQALTDGRWMAIRSDSGVEIYDLQRDPAQAHDVAATQPPMAAAMTSRINAIRSIASSNRESAVSSETAERLRALGYVASSSPRVSTSGAPNPAAHIEAW